MRRLATMKRHRQPDEQTDNIIMSIAATGIRSAIRHHRLETLREVTLCYASFSFCFLFYLWFGISSVIVYLLTCCVRL